MGGSTGDTTMNRNKLRQRSGWFLGSLVLGAFGTATPGLAADAGPAAACAKLATLTSFPVTPTQITAAKFNAAGAAQANGMPLPAHCQVQGVIHKRVGTDGFPYGAGFELRLPAPQAWNGRFMFQGGGGTEGAVPPA